MINTSLNLYGLILIISFILEFTVICYFSQNQLSSHNRFYFIIYLLIGIIFGGKYYTLITHHQFNEVSFITVGMSSVGSLIGGLTMLAIYSWQYKISLKKLANLVAPAIPLMYGIGKIGCFLTGCCLGFKYTGVGAITYKYSQIVSSEFSYFPIQIIESITFIFLFFYLYHLANKKDPQVISKCLILWETLKFILEFFRLKSSATILSINQIVCLFLIFLGFIIYKFKSPKKPIY